jgi:hypothetical protein
MCVSVRKIGGIGSTASLGGGDRENLLSERHLPSTRALDVHTPRMNDARPRTSAELRRSARAQFQRIQHSLASHTCSLSLVDVRREDLGRQRAEKVPIVAGPEMGDPGVDGASPGRSPQRAFRSHALEKEDCKAVLAQRLAHGSPPRRACRDHAGEGRLRGKGHVLRTSLQWQKLFFLSPCLA